MAFAAEKRRHIAVFPAGLFACIHECADAGKTLEVFLDVRAGLLARDAELVGETERRDAVDDAEIDRLGPAAHLARHTLHRDAEHFARRQGVNVGPLPERALERLDVGDFGEEPQLDLRIIGRYELGARRRDKATPDLAALLA